jgi:hypothetical protein
MSTERKPIDVLAVMDTDGCAVAMLTDITVGRVSESWKTHLPVHDEARELVAELLAAIEQDATERAMKCGLGVSEWRSLIPPRTLQAFFRIGGSHG